MGYIGNIEVNLKSNDVNIITSGTAMTFNKGADLRISLRLANDFFLSVVFQFEDNSALDKPELQITTSGNNIKLTCVNFNDFIGVGTVKPLKLAQYEYNDIYKFYQYPLH